METNEIVNICSVEVYNFDGYKIEELFKVLSKPGWKLDAFEHEIFDTFLGEDRRWIQFFYEDDFIIITYSCFAYSGILHSPNVNISLKIFGKKGGSKE